MMIFSAALKMTMRIVLYSRQKYDNHFDFILKIKFNANGDKN